MSGAERPDLDSREHVEGFVDAFYDKVLADPTLAPIFLDVAAVDLKVHLPHIKNYWSKLLLGETGYRRHTMNIHRALNQKRNLEQADFERWLSLFIGTLEEGFCGPQTERAKRIAASIAANMHQGIHSTH